MMGFVISTRLFSPDITDRPSGHHKAFARRERVKRIRLDRFRDDLVQQSNNACRRLSRSIEPIPTLRRIAGHSSFRNGRQIRERRGALRRGHGEHAKLPRLDQGGRAAW